MATIIGTRSLEEIGVYSDESSTNSGDSTKSKSAKKPRNARLLVAQLTESTPPIMEPDENRTAYGFRRNEAGPSRLTQSDRFQPAREPSIHEPGPADGRRKRHKTESSRQSRSDPNLVTPVTPPTELVEPNSSMEIFCPTCAATTMKKSAFLFVVQLLISAIPFSAVVMGLLYNEYCPKNSILPVFSTVVGVLGVLFMALWVFVVCRDSDGTSCSRRQKIMFGFAYFVIFVLTIVDASFVGTLSPSFDPDSSEYCNETFYTYSFYKEIATAVVFVLSAICYIPGCGHLLCCFQRHPPPGYYAI